MKIPRILAWAILLLSYAAYAAMDSNRGEDRYALTISSPVLISVDSGWQRDGLIPVRIDVTGLLIDLWMDGEGRVLDDGRLESGAGELFRLDTSSGRLQAGGRTLNGRVYERNALRTRLSFSIPATALLIDIERRRSSLDLGGIIIPARVHVGQDVSGMRELEIGSTGDGAHGRLLLDSGRGRLYFERQRAGRLYWAERRGEVR